MDAAELSPGPGAAPALKRFAAHSPFYPLPQCLFFVGLFLLILQGIFSSGNVIFDSPLSAAIGLAFASALGLSVLLCLIPSRIIVGTDGVERSWLWFHRFVPFTAVKRFHVRLGINPCLDLHDGRRIFLPLPKGNKVAWPKKEWEYTPMIFGIGEALANAGKKGAERDDSLDNLLEKRPGESIAEWKARLSSEESGYRERAIRTGDLWNVISAPSANARVRIGAALILANTGEEPEKQRIAGLASMTANPQLRVALEHIAAPAPEEDVLEELVKNVSER